ncbi:MAG: alpha-N-acetylglucosaminidase [Clostridia bacterium]|nr:alpha-N-acetylglucosaminidase [Clostridia bacterium]
MYNKLSISKDMIFSQENSEEVFKIFDSNKRTKWVGGQFPNYVDVKLNSMHRIKRLVVDCMKNDILIFSVFSSVDFVNYTEVITQKSDIKCSGHYEFDCDFEACSLRFLFKYSENTSYATVKNIEIFGEESKNEIKKADVSFPEPFEESEYNVKITKEDTVKELSGLIERTVGKEFCEKIVFSIEDSEEEFFTLSDAGDEKISITANSGSSAAAGLNYYYKNYCSVHISQVGCSANMPSPLPKIGKTKKVSTPFKVRYANNYCSLSYTMAFYGEEEWQKELDYYALQGVNVFLDITAIEEVWRRFLLKLGYPQEKAIAFLPGPAYYAWFCMANLYSTGAPLPPGYFKKRTDLARKNHLFMRRMGMSPVFQGYNGMVPTDIKKYAPDVSIIPQGLWNGAERPAMLKTDTNAYLRLADLFYESQREVYGDISPYFATDPFHEGGRSGRLDIKKVSSFLLDAILKNREDAVWIIQSWGENPSKELLEGVADRKEHTLILDLYAEKRPRWENFLGSEFLGSPWVYCMLNNFGGRMGLHGHLATIASEISRASKKAKHMKGIGITPEATHSNPIIFDLFFETIWTETNEIEPIKLEEWLQKYAERRYGSCSENMFEAMKMLNDTVYNPKLNEHGEGAPESVINARPSLDVGSPSTWGNNLVSYDKKTFEKAVELFLCEAGNCADSEGYLFDAIDLLKQVLSNTAQEYQKNMSKAFKEKDLIAFMKWSDKFLNLGLFTDEVLSANREFMLGNWLSKAEKLAEGFDDFTKKIFLFNARAQITTWGGSRQIAEDGALRDYSNKQWSGLTKDFYVDRWNSWVKVMKQKLNGQKAEEPDWFKNDIRWVWKENEYGNTPTKIDLLKTAEKVFSTFGVTGAEY